LRFAQNLNFSTGNRGRLANNFDFNIWKTANQILAFRSKSGFLSTEKGVGWQTS
jgi:hypothetical protein